MTDNEIMNSGFRFIRVKCAKILVVTLLILTLHPMLGTIQILNHNFLPNAYAVTDDVYNGVTDDVYGHHIEFPDPNLEEAIRLLLDKETGNITSTDMQQIVELEIPEWDVSNLSGLEYATNLERLVLDKNPIGDLSVLAELHQLIDLSLHETNSTDLSPLASLSNLQVLDVSANGISDISALQNLTELTYLYLEENNLSDINPLRNLQNLEILYLYDNPIDSLDPLEDLTDLIVLDAGYTTTDDISAIASLTGLVELYIDGNQVGDISAIRDLNELTVLWMNDNHIEDISALEGLVNLEQLIMGYNNIHDISAVGGLVNLTELWMESNQITDISPIENLTQLTGLFMYNNRISNIDSLASLTQLQYLDLESNQISDISALENLTALEFVYLTKNQISDITALQNITGLQYLYIEQNQITDISALNNLTNLHELWAEQNHIRDLTPLGNLTQLELLSVFSNEIDNIEALDSLTQLTSLYLDDNQISELSPLSKLTNLEELYINKNRVEDITPLANLSNLLALGLSENNIDTLPNLSNLTRLEFLELHQNQLTDVTPLLGLNFNVVQFISLFGNQIEESVVTSLLDYLQSNGGVVSDTVGHLGYIQLDGLVKEDTKITFNETEAQFGDTLQSAQNNLYEVYDAYGENRIIYMFEASEGTHTMEVSNGAATETLTFETNIQSPGDIVYYYGKVFYISYLDELRLEGTRKNNDRERDTGSGIELATEQDIPSPVITADGGTITNDELIIEIPALATEEEIQITVEKVTNLEALNMAEEKILVSEVFEITKDKEGSFDKPVTITIHFNTERVDSTEQELIIAWYHEVTEEWVPLDNIKVDWNNGTILGDVNHFTKFAVFATEKTEPPPAPPAPPVYLTDIRGHWAEATITEMINEGIIYGYPDQTFRPNRTITKAEFFTLLANTYYLPTADGNVFADTADHWARAAIQSAAAAGILEHGENDLFEPNKEITREEMISMIVKTGFAGGFQSTSAKTNFTDEVSIDPELRDEIASALEMGWIQGYPDGSFRPKENASRAEAAFVIMRARNLEQESDEEPGRQE